MKYGMLRRPNVESGIMAEKSESAAREISVALTELIGIAESGGLPMLAYLLDMARVEARAQAGETPPRASNVLPFKPN